MTTLTHVLFVFGLSAVLTSPVPAADAPLPAGAIRRLGVSAFRVPDIAGVGLRADGATVAVTRDLKLYVWPAGTTATPTPRVLQERGSFVVELSADGRFVAADQRGRPGFPRLVVWDVSGKEPVVRLDRELPGEIRVLGFSPGGARLLIHQEERRPAQLAVHRLIVTRPDGAEWREFSLDGEYSEAMSFAADERRFAVVASAGNKIRVYDVDRDEPVLATTTVGFRPRSVALNPGGSVLAVHPTQFAGRAPEPVRLLSVPSGEPVAGLTPPPAGSDRWVTFHTDGKTLSLGGVDGIREWDPAGGKEARAWSGPAGRHPPVFAPDRRRLVGHTGYAVLLWDATTGKPVYPEAVQAGHPEAVHHVAVSPDGRSIVTMSMDGLLIAWAADTGRELWRGRSSWGNDRRLVFAPDSRTLIGVGPERTMPVVWDAATGKEVRRLDVPPERRKAETVSHLRLSPDGTTLTAGSVPMAFAPGARTATVRWDVASGRETGRTPAGPLDFDTVSGFQSFSADGRWVATGGRLVRLDTGEPVSPGPVSAFGGSLTRFSPDGRTVAFSRYGNAKPFDPAKSTVVLFDLDARAVVGELPTGQVTRLAFSPDGRVIAAGGQTEMVLWDVATGLPAARFQIQSGTTTVPQAVAFFPDGRRLATGQLDCTAVIWDASGVGRPERLPDLPADEFAARWDALAGGNAAKAYRAGWELADRPGQAVPLLRDRLKPVVADPAAEDLAARLDAPLFADREAAEKALRAIGDSAVPALVKLREAGASAEQRRRSDAILAAVNSPALPPGDRLRQVRAVAVLERVGSPEARAVLEGLAAGLPTARLTREARDSLRRLGDNGPNRD